MAQRNTAAAGLLLALLMSGLCGCAYTYLEGPPIGASYTKLAALAPRKVLVYVGGSSEETVVGHQYAFLAIPAGKVIVRDPKQLVIAALFRRMALRGLAPQFLESPPEGYSRIPYLNIDELSLSATAYDLFFFRRVAAAVTVTAEMRPLEVQFSARESAGHFRTGGFKTQLEQVVEEALDATLDSLLRGVGL